MQTQPICHLAPTKEWRRLGRKHAEKRECGRGSAKEWKISHVGLQRIKGEKLLLVVRYRHWI